jgi:hypothetical protein
VVGALTSGLLLEVNQFLGITPSFSINNQWYLVFAMPFEN